MAANPTANTTGDLGLDIVLKHHMNMTLASPITGIHQTLFELIQSEPTTRAMLSTITNAMLVRNTALVICVEPVNIPELSRASLKRNDFDMCRTDRIVFPAEMTQVYRNHLISMLDTQLSLTDAQYIRLDHEVTWNRNRFKLRNCATRAAIMKKGKSYLTWYNNTYQQLKSGKLSHRRLESFVTLPAFIHQHHRFVNSDSWSKSYAIAAASYANATLFPSRTGTKNWLNEQMKLLLNNSIRQTAKQISMLLEIRIFREELCRVLIPFYLSFLV